MMDPLPSAVGLARTLAAAGVPVGPERTSRFVAALAEVDAARRDDVFRAGGVTLCANRIDLVRYERVFAAYLDGDRLPARRRTRVNRPQVVTAYQPSGSVGGDGAADPSARRSAAARATEVLRHRNTASLAARRGRCCDAAANRPGCS